MGRNGGILPLGGAKVRILEGLGRWLWWGGGYAPKMRDG